MGNIIGINGKYSKQVISFIPTSESCIVAPPEEFRDITTKIVPGIKNYYMISNYGRVWHKYKNKILIPYVDSKGYLFIRLTTIKGDKNCRIHRLVLMAFDYFNGCESAIINHIDGNKCNPCIWNLEWSNYSENLKHAWKNEIMVRKTSSEAREKIIKVCELLEENKLTDVQIAEQLDVSVDFVYSIYNKRAHVNISKNYNFPQKKGLFTEEQIKRICFFLSINKKENIKYSDIEYYIEALKYAGVTNIANNTIDGVRRILNRESYKNISSNYNF